jgi:2-polyprenyl-3-methyl-5-hydroxy-6-metoxy-1,4-benzoquinol methylase
LRQHGVTQIKAKRNRLETSRLQPLCSKISESPSQEKQMEKTLAGDSYSRSSPLSESERDRMDDQFFRNTSLSLHLALSSVDTREVISVADFGSGYGPSSSVLAERGLAARLHYIDVNEQLLALARERALTSGLMVNAIVGSLDAPQVFEFKADVALASFVLAHCADLKQAVQNLASSVRVGGAVVVADVDYGACAVDDDDSAAATLRSLQERLKIHDLSAQIDCIAAEVGLRPNGGFACLDWIDVTDDMGGVKRDALGFVGNFAKTDPAYLAWERIGPNARMYTRRLRRVYRRIN